MTNPARKRWVVIIESVLFAILFFMQYSGLSPLRIAYAKPTLLLPALITFAMFNSELPSALCGLVIGIFADSTAAAGFCFHTLLYFLIGFAVSFSLHYYFNNHLPTALLLGFLAGFFAYLCRWLVIYAARETPEACGRYLLLYALPGILLSEILLIPLYFLQRRLAAWKQR